MSPLPPDDPITLPEWIIQHLIAPIGVGVFSLLWWLGSKVISNWESEREELRREVEDIKAEIKDMHKDMGTDHGEVEDYVRRLDNKLDQVLDQV